MIQVTQVRELSVLALSASKVGAEPKAPVAEDSSRFSGSQQAASPGTSEATKIAEEEVRKAVEQANATFTTLNQKIGFGYEKRLNQIYVQVLDRETGEVVKEIPPKEFIEHRAAMREMIGLILDKQG